MSINSQFEKKTTQGKSRKQFALPASEIFIEPGFNIRDLDEGHVEEFAVAYEQGKFFPPLVVEEAGPGRFRLVDGHHRYSGIMKAIERGAPDSLIDVKEFSGSDADKIELMIVSSQGRALTVVERASAYQRLIEAGCTVEEVSKRVGRSLSDVRNVLRVAKMPDPLKAAISTGLLNYANAITIEREHGDAAPEFVEKLIKEADEEGAKKITSKIIKKASEKAAAKSAKKKTPDATFPVERAMRLLEIVEASETEKTGKKFAFYVSPEHSDEIHNILSEYIEFRNPELPVG